MISNNKMPDPHYSLMQLEKDSNSIHYLTSFKTSSLSSYHNKNNHIYQKVLEVKNTAESILSNVQNAKELNEKGRSFMQKYLTSINSNLNKFIEALKNEPDNVIINGKNYSLNELLKNIQKISNDINLM